MHARVLIAALTLPFVAVPPLSAQRLPSMLMNSSVRPVAPAAANGTESLQVAEDPYARQKRRKGHIGGFALRENVDVGLGYYKVRRDAHVEEDFKKLRPMEDNPGRQKRVAAVRLNVRF